MCVSIRGLDRKQSVLLTHGDSVSRVGDGLVPIGSSGDIITAIANESLNIYGLQFHPEVYMVPSTLHII